jgi:large subunit ribosomal protein L29
MELKELRHKPESELHKLLVLARENFRDLRFKIISKQHKDVREIRQVKKMIARILTVLKEKKMVKEYSQKTNKDKVK